MGVEGDARDKRTGSRWQRRRFLVDPLFQWKYTGLAVASVFVVSLVTSAMLFGTLHEQARLRMLSPEGGNAWANTLLLLGAATVFSAGLCLAFGVWAMKLTHRVSGPLYLMGQQLASLSEGRFPKRRKLRAHDEFQCFYDDFWATMDALRGRERDSLIALERALASAKGAVRGDEQSRDIALAEIVRQLEVLRNESAALLGCDQTGDTSRATTTEQAAASTDTPVTGSELVLSSLT